MADFATSTPIFLNVFIVLIVLLIISFIINIISSIRNGVDGYLGDSYLTKFLFYALLGEIPTFFLWRVFEILPFSSKAIVADFAVSMLIFLLVFIGLFIAYIISCVMNGDRDIEDNYVFRFSICAGIGGIPTFFLWLGFKFLPFILGLLAVCIFFYWLIIKFDCLIIDVLSKENIRFIERTMAMDKVLELIGRNQKGDGVKDD